ncbi:MAG: class I SAM-dependent methyltransferase [Aquificae bacterium]|nr:class I SAM-dependent methyltransferase [Aquificota bacterium]
MIPFNYLGWAFKLFGKGIYPSWVFSALEKLVSNLQKDDYFLDIGAGTGVLIEEAFKQNPNPRYVAVDPAYGMLKYIQKPVEKVVAKAEYLPFKENTFSMVTLGETLHHIKDIETGLREINRVMKKDGYLFIFDFDPTQKKGRLIYRFEKMFGEPANFFEPKKLKHLLKDFHFESEYVKKEYRYILIARKIK